MVLLWGMLLVFVAAPALASDAVCGDAARPQCGGTVGATRYVRSVEPVGFAEAGCVLVPEADTAAQRTLVETVAASHPNGRCHLKVVGGLAVAMTQPEKDAVNAAIQVVLDDQAAYEEAVANNDLCSATLDQLATAKAALDSNLTDDIAGITNIATAKTELQDMMTRLTNAMEKLMRCIRGRAGPPAQ